MNEEIQSLINSLRRGQYEDPAEKIGLLAAALVEHKADPAFILSLLRAPQIPLRLAALDACRGRTEPEILTELQKLAADPEARVRTKLAEVLSTFGEKEAGDILKTLAEAGEGWVRRAAIQSMGGKPMFLELQRKALADDADSDVRVAAATALGEQKIPLIVKDLLTVFARESSYEVQVRCAEILERRLTHTKVATEKHLPTEIGLLTRAHAELKDLGVQRFPKLIEWIGNQTTVKVNPETLAHFGTDLTALAEAGTLLRAYGAEEPCATLLKMIAREPWRSIALVGDAGVGKSAIVHELVYELAKPEHGGWRVLRISPSDFMTGTRYLGDWETKVKEIVEAARKPKRVLIYVPSLSDLSAAGRWSKSDSNVATALAPYMEEGSILLLGESTAADFERGVGSIPSLRRVFDCVLLKEADAAQTRKILGGIRDAARVEVSDEVIDQVQDLASQFLSHISRPGNAAALLRAVLSSDNRPTGPVSARDVLAVLSKSTGVPADLMDDSLPLKLEQVKGFFDQKILGQPEAIEAVVDLVTLIKAGLTDPEKPFGVYLFVGPTGVGKTELAKALAEFIFGDAGRLLRYDMSEYATPESFQRLIGGKDESGLLTDAVRRQPFSVVLLDEIEKAHLNIFDLCLQIFDAGRLTDGHGRTVNFRRTIIILTSNIGAEGPLAALGFNAAAQPQLAIPDKDRTFRELSRFFRPEFLNRIDRIINFRPLTPEVADRIARRELALVIQRTGIARRKLTVDIDPALVALLIKEGYSPHFGARPLKRTVERLCLLPLGRAIATGKIAENSVLCLGERNGRVSVEVTTRAPMPAKVFAPSASSRPDLQARLDELEARMQPLADRKSELLQETQRPGFYDDVPKRNATFDEISKLEQLLVWRDRVRGAVAKLSRAGRPRPSEAELENVATEIEQLRFVSSCRDATDLGDALLCLATVEKHGDNLDAIENLVRMYSGFSSRRRMAAEVIGESPTVYLQVTGLGAFALLKDEAGLHSFSRHLRTRSRRNGREKAHEDTEIVRVEVLSLLSEPDKTFVAALKTTVQQAKAGQFKVSLFHQTSMRSLDVQATGSKDEANRKAQRILHAQLQSAGSGATRNAVVRQYEIGIGARIKDLRTGKSTTQIPHVFKGRLELLLSVT